jgi:UDP-N-acetylglucosamine 1-carboxyvinyltransferase
MSSEYLEIIGGEQLKGDVAISGAKNAALPILIASLLTSEKCTFKNVPHLEDVSRVLLLLETFGAEIEYSGGAITVQTKKLLASEASLSLVKSLRASFWVLGPLLARGGAARVALPGGDIIGARPVDIHLEALRQMGAQITIKHGIVYASAVKGLNPTEINFRFPSVGATHQVIMAAALTNGTTVLRGAALEPEIVAIADFLHLLGVSVEGAGTSTIVIQGNSALRGTEYTMIGDRIEAGSYLCSACTTYGKLTVRGVNPHWLLKVLATLEKMGCEIDTEEDAITIHCKKRILPVNVYTGPFPEFPTDLQAPLMAALCYADGKSTIEENIYEGRFGNASELCRMGADIRVHDRVAEINGVETLSGASVDALDIRAGASLVVAALGAQGVTDIHEINHIQRGYEHIDKKFQGIGAKMRYRLTDPEDYVFTGC